jgi:hypothetical protein
MAKGKGRCMANMQQREGKTAVLMKLAKKAMR